MMDLAARACRAATSLATAALATAVLATAALTATAAGAAGPPITLTVAAVPGGAVDHVARLLGRQLEADFGRPVVVENRAGGGSRIAADAVAKAAPDGNALLVTTGTSAIDVAFYPDVHPNILTDFVPVARLATGTLVFVVRVSSQLRTAQDIVARARAAPGALSYGTVNVQSTQFLVGELFKLGTQTQMTQIPYKAEAAIMAAIAAGDLDFGIVGIGTAMPMIQAGMVRPIAVAGDSRAAVLPEVPTLAESGVRIVTLGQWYGLLAPAGTPAPVVDALARSAARAGESPEYRRSLEAIGLEVGSGTPAQFASFLQSEVVKIRDIIAAAHLRTP